jgi:hypothetical protein
MATEPTNDDHTGRRVIWLALVSLAAAGIHFALIGDHVDEHVAFGLFFAVVAWGQALWAVAMLIAPVRWLLVAGLAGNLAVIVVWALSRTIGLPLGPDPWSPEAANSADLLATGLELAIVIGCALPLARGVVPAPRKAGRGSALALGASLAVLTSAVIATGGGHAHVDEAASDHHDTATEIERHGHALAGGNGEPDLAQIEVVEDAMKKYRDVRVAYADGWEKEHMDWPELGAHFFRASDWAGSGPARPDLDLVDPEFLMYSRFLTGEWKLVAVAYVLDQALYPEPPDDLTGAIYHQHRWNCIKGGEELEEEDWGVLSQEECDIMGGRWSPGGVWMTHVWLVDNPNGIFAETNPTLVALH